MVHGNIGVRTYDAAVAWDVTDGWIQGVVDDLNLCRFFPLHPRCDKLANNLGLSAYRLCIRDAIRLRRANFLNRAQSQRMAARKKEN